MTHINTPPPATTNDGGRRTGALRSPAWAILAIILGCILTITAAYTQGRDSIADDNGHSRDTPAGLLAFTALYPDSNGSYVTKGNTGVICARSIGEARHMAIRLIPSPIITGTADKNLCP